MQKPLYDFSISKDMAASISTCKSICDFHNYIEADLSGAYFLSQVHAYLLLKSGLFQSLTVS